MNTKYLFAFAVTVGLIGCTEKNYQSSSTNEAFLRQHKTIQTPKEGLQAMTDVLVRFAQPHENIQSLLSYLVETNQQPKVFVDKSDYIEDLYTIRTENPLKGTAYFEAMYEERDQVLVLMHLSFDYKKGIHSLEEAKAAVKSSLEENPLPEGYHIWVKELVSDDLMNPTNPYTTEDLGTVRVTLEILRH